MNKDEISNKINFIKYNKDIYQNIIVVNKDKKIIYGYIENEKTALEEDYMKKAFLGEFAISQPILFNGRYYLDIVNCIKKDKDVVGVICFRILSNDISKLIKYDIRQEGVECYIVDKSGKFITNFKLNDNTIEKIDLDRIKLNIDYSSVIPYKNYMDKLVYGMYYSVGINDWTLIIEKEASTSTQILRIIIFTGIVNTIINIISMFFMKRFLIKDCIENQVD